MDEQKIEKIIERVQSESDDRMKRYIGVVTENIDDKFKVIGEQFQIINKKLDEHTEMIGDLKKDMTEVKIILSNHTKTLDSHTEMIGAIAEDVTVLKEEMREVKV